MAIHYNCVFDRAGKRHQLYNCSWPQFVSTLTPPVGNQLADGTYQPSLSPVDSADVTEGAQYVTPWWSGPLSPLNNRGRTQFMPSNLIAFDGPGKKVAENPTLPENQRELQFTVNGQFQPELKIKPGQTGTWVVANISEIAHMTVGLTLAVLASDTIGVYGVEVRPGYVGCDLAQEYHFQFVRGGIAVAAGIDEVNPQTAHS